MVSPSHNSPSDCVYCYFHNFFVTHINTSSPFKHLEVIRGVHSPPLVGADSPLIVLSSWEEATRTMPCSSQKHFPNLPNVCVCARNIEGNQPDRKGTEPTSVQQTYIMFGNACPCGPVYVPNCRYFTTGHHLACLKVLKQVQEIKATLHARSHMSGCRTWRKSGCPCHIHSLDGTSHTTPTCDSWCMVLWIMQTLPLQTPKHHPLETNTGHGTRGSSACTANVTVVTAHLRLPATRDSQSLCRLPEASFLGRRSVEPNEPNGPGRNAFDLDRVVSTVSVPSGVSLGRCTAIPTTLTAPRHGPNGTPSDQTNS